MKLSGLMALISVGAAILAPFTGGLSLGAISLQQALYATSIIAGAISANLQAEELKKKMKKGSGHLLNTIDTKANIPIVYGECRVGGNIVYRTTRGSNNKYLYQVYTLTEGQMKSLKDVYFDGHIPEFMSLKQKTHRKWVYKIDDTVTNLEFDIRIVDKSTNEYFGRRYHIAENFRIARGETKTLDTGTFISPPPNQPVLTITFDDASNTLTIEITSATDITVPYISQISGRKYSNDNGNTWNKILLNTDLYEYIYFDGDDWYRYDSTTTTWIKDNDVNTNRILGEIADSTKYDNVFDYSKIDKSAGNPPVSVLAVEFKSEENKWAGVPQVTALIEGQIKSNPFNNNTVELITNPVWALFDYMTNNVYGLGVPKSEFEGYDTATDTFSATSTWKKAYDYCEAKGFEFNGVFTDGKGFDIVKQILDHFIGYTIRRNGKRECHYNYFDTSDTTYSNPIYSKPITAEDIIDDVEITNIAWEEIPQKLKVNFLNPVKDYKEDVVEIEVNDGHLISEDIVTVDLLGCDYDTAKYIGTYMIERQREGYSVNVKLPYEYIDLDWGDIIYVDYPERNIAGHFRVIGKTINEENISLTLLYESENFYNTVIDTPTYDYSQTDDINVKDQPPEVQSLSYTLSHELKADGTFLTYITLNWINDYSWIGSYTIYESVDGVNYFSIGETTDKTFKFVITDNIPNVYVKVVPKSVYGVKRDILITTPITIPINPDGVAPATPTGLNAITTRTSDSLTIYLHWDENTEKDLAGYKVYVSKATETFANAVPFRYVQGNSISILFPAELPTAYQSETSLIFYLTAIDNIGNESAETSITVNTTFTPLEDEVAGTVTPTGVATLNVTAFYDEWYLTWSGVTDDRYGYNIHVYSDSTGTTEVAVLKIDGNTFHYKEDTPDPRWFKVVALNSDGTEATSTASSIVAGGSLPKMVANQVIAQETVTWDLVEAGSKPPKVWTGATLPPVVDYPEGQLLYWAQDKKLYRNTGTVWEKKIPTADLDGQIAETQIADNSISTPKLQANSITGDKIQASTITGDKISANTITAGNIASATITGDKIKGNTITAKHLVVADTSNLFPEQWWIDGEYDDTRYLETRAWLSNVVGKDNETIPVCLVYRNRDFYVTDYMPVDAGNKYYVSAWLKNLENSDYDTTIGIHFKLADGSNSWNSVGTYLSAKDNNANYITTWRKLEGYITAPTNATKMRIWFQINKTNNTQTDRGWAIYNIIYRRASDSTLIVDGAITSTKIQANSITADKLNVSELSSINANTGTLTISGASNGYIKTSSKTGFNDGSSGFWLDKNSNFELYNSTNDRGIIFDSANGNLTVKGEITVNSFNITDIDNISTGLRIPLVPSNSRGISIDTQINAEYGIYIKTSNPAGATAKGLYSISSNVAIEGVCPSVGGGSSSIAIKGINPYGYAGWFESSDNVAIKLNAPKHLEVNVQTAKPTGTAPDGTIIFALDGANNVRMYIAYQGNWYESGINSTYAQV